jgi:hypothetical protein
MPVRTGPGRISLTVMPSAHSSCDSTLDSIARPALAQA